MKILKDTECPSCKKQLIITRYGCQSCDTSISGEFDLPPLAKLSVEDQKLVCDYVKCGSIKQLCKDYNLSYPTARKRFNGLIARLIEVETNSLQDEEGKILTNRKGQIE